ncbi:MAG: hypothetical protein D6765_15070 [Bacteroidetes bacterium]|nr:MAG: hypothetical protein D6765_15070 [Bacteroidota bacterium]
MALIEKASLIIYRFAEKGLEVFLVKPDKDDEPWSLPAGRVEEQQAADRLIELDPVEQEDGKVEKGVAIEGDWHDIPSLKSMLRQDVEFVKEQLEQLIPDAMNRGAYVAVKDAVKRVLPHQYKMLKELKDILIDRHSVRDL